jgi:hypothetical protein
MSWQAAKQKTCEKCIVQVVCLDGAEGNYQTAAFFGQLNEK